MQKAAEDARITTDAELAEAIDEKNLTAERGVELETCIEGLENQIADLAQQVQHDAGRLAAMREETQKAHHEARAVVDKAWLEAANERQGATQPALAVVDN